MTDTLPQLFAEAIDGATAWKRVVAACDAFVVMAPTGKLKGQLRSKMLWRAGKMAEEMLGARDLLAYREAQWNDGYNV